MKIQWKKIMQCINPIHLTSKELTPTEFRTLKTALFNRFLPKATFPTDSDTLQIENRKVVDVFEDPRLWHFKNLVQTAATQLFFLDSDEKREKYLAKFFEIELPKIENETDRKNILKHFKIAAIQISSLPSIEKKRLLEPVKDITAIKRAMNAGSQFRTFWSTIYPSPPLDNPIEFIRSFKFRTGLTPSEYSLYYRQKTIEHSSWWHTNLRRYMETPTNFSSNRKIYDGPDKLIFVDDEIRLFPYLSEHRVYNYITLKNQRMKILPESFFSSVSARRGLHLINCDYHWINIPDRVFRMHSLSIDVAPNLNILPTELKASENLRLNMCLSLEDFSLDSFIADTKTKINKLTLICLSSLPKVLPSL